MFIPWLRFRRSSIFDDHPKPCRSIIPGESYTVAFPIPIGCLKTPWKYVRWNLCEKIYTLGLCCIHDIYQLGLTGHANQPKPWPSCISAIRPQTSKQWALSAPDIRIHGDGAKFRICTWQIWPSGSVGWEFLRQSVYVFCLIERRKKCLLKGCQNPTHNAAK